MIKDKLVVYGVQGIIFWEDADANLKHIERIINGIRILPDILVLPETFTTGFSNNTAACAEGMNGNSIRTLKDIAQKKDIAICGSLIIEEEGDFYNRFIFIHPDGTTEAYDKRHLFSVSGEDKAYSPGNKRVIINYKGWRILLQVCYDLRFPVWSRNCNDYDLAIYVANWPKVRQYVWDTLLKARAIENQCYVFGLNRTGNDPNNIEYYGQSMFVDFKGHVMNMPHSNEALVSLELSKTELDEFRKAFPVLRDGDTFELKV